MRYCRNERTANAAASTSASVCGDVDEAPDCMFPAESKGLPPPLWSFVLVCSLESADEVLDPVAEGAALVSITMLEEAEVAAVLELLGVGAGLVASMLSLDVLEAEDAADVALVSMTRLEATDVTLLAVMVLAGVDGGAGDGVLDGACAL